MHKVRNFSMTMARNRSLSGPALPAAFICGSLTNADVQPQGPIRSMTNGLPASRCPRPDDQEALHTQQPVKSYRTFASDTEILMSYRSAMLAAIATAAVAGAAHAEALKPVQARKVDLGAVAGVAYYTVEKDGHRLVVSLKAPDTGTPVRFVATLAPEQQVTLSVPRSAGEAAVDVNFIRRGEKIEVNATGMAPHLESQGD
jgi:hypothetical protein